MFWRTCEEMYRFKCFHILVKCQREMYFIQICGVSKHNVAKKPRQRPPHTSDFSAQYYKWLQPVLLVVFCDLERGSMSLVSTLWWDRKRVNSGQLAVIPGQLVAFFFYIRAWIIFGIKEILVCLLGTGSSCFEFIS